MQAIHFSVQGQTKEDKISQADAGHSLFSRRPDPTRTKFRRQMQVIYFSVQDQTKEDEISWEDEGDSVFSTRPDQRGRGTRPADFGQFFEKLGASPIDTAARCLGAASPIDTASRPQGGFGP